MMQFQSHTEHDPAGSKFQRLIFGLLLLTAFILDQIIIVTAVAALMILFAFIPIRYSPIYQLHRLFSSLPDETACECNANEATFACSLGAIFLLIGIICYYQGMVNLAWILVLIVAVLSLLAGTVGFCLGSLIFVWLKMRFRDDK